MDNKKDKQFYWEVKDFLTRNRNNNKPVQKSASLKDVSKNILEQNNLFKQKPSQASEDIINNTKNILGSLEKERRGYDVPCVAYTRNNIANPFKRDLLEYSSVDTAEAAARRRAEAEARNQAARERNAAANASRDAAKADVKRRREEDEAYQYNKEQEAKGQGPMPNGGNVSDGLEMGRDGNPNLPADTPENRKRMGEWRREKADTRQAEYMAKRMEELSAKDPSTLTASEAGELSLFKGMLSGPNASKGLETRVKENISKSAEAEASAAQGPMPDGGNRATEPSTKAANVFASTVGRSQEDLINQSQQAGASEAAQKAAEQAEFNEKQAEQRRAAMQNVRIQGTNMTYGEFEAQYGRPYDALNREDSTMLVRSASNRSAFRVSPTARALDQTTVDFNRTYRDINAQNAAREGELDRRVDSAQISLDQFNADRRGTVQREISTIQAQPGFVRNVAQSMSSPGATPARIGQPTAPVGGATPTAQPARIGAPSLSQAINSVLGNNKKRA